MAWEVGEQEAGLGGDRLGFLGKEMGGVTLDMRRWWNRFRRALAAGPKRAFCGAGLEGSIRVQGGLGRGGVFGCLEPSVVGTWRWRSRRPRPKRRVNFMDTVGGGGLRFFLVRQRERGLWEPPGRWPGEIGVVDG